MSNLEQTEKSKTMTEAETAKLQALTTLISATDKLNSNSLNCQSTAGESAALKLYLQCIEIRNFEIQNLVNRNNFFMIFQGVLMAGVIQGSKESLTIVTTLASICGFFISLMQIGMSSGAKFWQEAWEGLLEGSEIKLGMSLGKIIAKEPDSPSAVSASASAPTATPSSASALLAMPTKDLRIAEKDYVVGADFQLLFAKPLEEIKEEMQIRFKTKKQSSITSSLIFNFSVSRIPIYSGIVFSIFWLLMLLVPAINWIYTKHPTFFCITTTFHHP